MFFESAPLLCMTAPARLQREAPFYKKNNSVAAAVWFSGLHCSDLSCETVAVVGVPLQIPMFLNIAKTVFICC